MLEKERFIAFLERPSDLKEMQAGQEVFARQEVHHFIRSIQDVDEALRELAPLLTNVDGFHAGALALLCGSLVERDGDVALPIEAALELTLRQLQQALSYRKVCRDLSGEELFLHFPEATRAHYALNFTLLAAMTMLSRDKQKRKEWQQSQDIRELVNDVWLLCEEQRERYDPLVYIKELLNLLDDKELLVLDPLDKRGFLVRLEGVQDRMYHCYALLQYTLLEHVGPGYLNAKPVDPEAVHYAQNRDLAPEDHQRAEELSDEQRFAFYYPGALQQDEEGYELNAFAFFPGSASFYEIPRFDSMPVLLIGEKTTTFTWRPNNMYPVLHDALKSRVRIMRELPLEEVETMLQRIVEHTHS